VWVDPIKPALKAPGTKLLKLIYDGPLSNIAFKFNLRRYVRAVDLATMAVTSVAGTAAFPESGGTVASDGANAGDVLPGSQVGQCRLNP